MKINKLFLLLILPLIIVYGCCRDVSCRSFTKDERLWMPYGDGDTLVFKNFNNDSIISLYARNAKSGSFNSKSQDAMCSDSCYTFTSIELRDVSEKGLHLILQYYLENSIKTFYLGINIHGAEYRPSNQSFYYFNLNDAEYIDSLKISNYWIHEVYRYKITKDNLFDDMYCSKGKGIVLFTLKNNQTFQLINIKKN